MTPLHPPIVGAPLCSKPTLPAGFKAMSKAKQLDNFRPSLLVSAITALISILVGAIGGFVIWIDDPTLSFPAVIAGAVSVWLAAHGAGITIDSVDVTFVPLGLPVLISAVGWFLISRFKPSADRQSALLIVVSYGLIVFACAIAFSAVHPFRALFGALLISSLAVLVAFRKNFKTKIPKRFESAVRGVYFSLLIIAAGGLTVVAASLLVHRTTFSQMWMANSPNVIGFVFMLLLTLLMVPNISLWAISVMLGPGFALGAQTGVDFGGSQLVAVPSIPIFAAVPPAGGFGTAVFVLALIPLVAAGVAGWQGSGDGSLGKQIGSGALTGLASGVLLSGALAISGGAIGPELMSETGPNPLSVSAFAVVIFTVGGAIGAVLKHYRGKRAEA